MRLGQLHRTRSWSHGGGGGGGWLWLLLCLTITAVVAAFAPSRCTTTHGIVAVPRICAAQLSTAVRRHQRFGDCKSKTRIRDVPRPNSMFTLSLTQLESSMYNEHRPMRRKPLSLKTVTVESRDDRDRRREWGVFDYYDKQQPITTAQEDHGTTAVMEFPDTIRAVVQAAAATVCAALCHEQETPEKGKIAQNQTSKSHQQPQQHGIPREYIISGRIGIELDFGGGHDESGTTHNTAHDEAATVRYAALVLASRLAQSSTWQPYESSTTTTTTTTTTRVETPPHLRPIAVYFNTVQQALAASQQLLHLKRVEWHRQSTDSSPTTSTTTSRPATIYDSILIRCLCQGDSIPKQMMRPENEEMENTNATIPGETFIGNDEGKRLYRKAVSSSSSRVNPALGLLLIVQPTDYNTDFVPPGPVLSAAHALQTLSMRASLEQLGVVVLSPRFVNYPATEEDCTNRPVVSSHGTGWDEQRRRRSPSSLLENAKFAQSSSFAGLEPPRGATPWILRDYWPPIFTWVAHSLPLESSMSTSTTSRRRSLETSLDDTATHLVLWQSILHPDTAWHMFAVSAPSAESRSRSSSGARARYIASTQNAAGRPTRDILHRLYMDHLLCCT
jgi:hypothetical protein